MEYKKITQNFKGYNLLDSHEKINIAVIDSGIDYSHKESKGKIDYENSYNFVNESKIFSIIMVTELWLLESYVRRN